MGEDVILLDEKNEKIESNPEDSFAHHVVRAFISFSLKKNHFFT